MNIENIELTMSHVGLGSLNEYALMVLFGNAHSHHLTLGLAITPDQIKDEQNQTLYPAYFMTHLKVPTQSLLSTYRLWDKVEVGVDITRFGETLLNSVYVLGRKGQIPQDVALWPLDETPSMKANNLITVDVTELAGAARRVSIPRPDCIVDLPKIKKAPEAIIRARNIRADGFEIKIDPKLAPGKPFEYYVVCDQDAAPGHAMLFAKYVKIMDWAEFLLLSKYLQPGFQFEVLQNLAILEREVYYFGNCFAGETLDVYIQGNIEECSADYHGNALNIISTALFTFQIEIYQRRNQSLLAVSRVRKLLTMPTSMQDLILDVKRVIKSIKISG